MLERIPDAATERKASALQVETARAIVTWIVQNGLPVGYHLKEERLSQTFRLSRSPVRGALGLLGDHGVVEQRPDRGYFLAMSGEDLASGNLPLPQSANDELYRVVANAWFDGAIPDSVSTAELRRRYGQDVGRALERLAADGVIVRSAGKGWRLGPNLATAEAFHESYRFRMVIEPAAIELASFSLDRPLAARSRRRHATILDPAHAPTIKEMVDADLEFHHLIAASCGNKFFAEAIQRQNVLRRLTEMLTTPDGDRLRASSAEHVQILDAIESGRMKVAAALMCDHLTVSRMFSPDFLAAARDPADPAASPS